MGGSTSLRSAWTRQETATAYVECRCTTAPAVGRSWYMVRCSGYSFEGGSPEIKFPSQSSLDSRPGSRKPRHELVGVMNHPSSTRTLMLPEFPGLNPRLN